MEEVKKETPSPNCPVISTCVHWHACALSKKLANVEQKLRLLERRFSECTPPLQRPATRWVSNTHMEWFSTTRNSGSWGSDSIYQPLQASAHTHAERRWIIKPLKLNEEREEGSCVWESLRLFSLYSISNPLAVLKLGNNLPAFATLSP